MEYAPWLNDYDEDYATLALQLRNIEALEAISGKTRFYFLIYKILIRIKFGERRIRDLTQKEYT